MTPDQIMLVQDSFAKVRPIADKAADLFYTRLFEIAPEVRSLFSADMLDQGQKLMLVLGTVVYGLNKLESILPQVEALAVRHDAYGVVPELYEPVGAALLWTLEQGLGDAFTSETKAAWVEAYMLLSSTMIQASATNNSQISAAE